MKILAVDTSSGTGSVALLEDERLVAEWSLHSAQTHNRRLLKAIDFLLQETYSKLESVDAFAVTTGPGSFTGVRIGLSTVKTLAWAGRRLYAGIPSLDALAAAFSFAPFPVCALLDAKKKEVYFALYRSDENGNLVLEKNYSVAPPGKVVEEIKTPTIFCGDGWLQYRDYFLKELGGLAVEVPGPYHIIRASYVGALAFRRFCSGHSEDPMVSSPLYVRPSEAELSRTNREDVSAH